MGIAIAIVCFPLFIVCIIISLLTVDLAYRNATKVISLYPISKLNLRVIQIIGIILSITVNLAIMSFIPIDSNWNGFIENLAISLFGPLVIGYLFLLLSIFFKKRIRIVLNYLSSGALYSVSIFPFLSYCFFNL